MYDDLSLFHEKGGKFYLLKPENESFTFSLGDHIYPSCSAANNRSQTLWNILRPFEGKITLMAPHATRYGLDPYNNELNWHRTQHSFPDDEFFLWAGTNKSQKFGWDRFGSWISKNEVTSEELYILRRYFDEKYYNPNLIARRIYITFSKNTDVHISRLCQTNNSLENVILLSFPLEDLIRYPLSEWNTYPRSCQSYKNYEVLIRKHLDLSNLE